jgi:hypothetical protein
MKWHLVYFGLLICLRLNAQDKIYLLDGQKLEGKVSEISQQKITYMVGKFSNEIPVDKVLLIAFHNGRTQVFHASEKDLYQAGNVRPERKEGPSRINFQNEFYINTLALYNADVSLHYEYRLSSKQMGLGILGTYNFNIYATAPNAFIAVLSNGKKLYDAGAFVNFYASTLQSKQKLFYGVMFKYTEFTFSAVKEDSIYINNTLNINVSYQPARSSQFSTFFNLGFHSDVTETFFIKSSFAIGFFILNGVYKQQFNYSVSDPQSGYYPNFTVLPKASAGICVGLKF